MPVIVESDPVVLDALLPALPPGSQVVSDLDRADLWLDAHDDEYVVVLGPDVELDAALGTAERIRTGRPAVSVVMLSSTPDAAVLSQAMQAGVREVVASDDAAGLQGAVTRAHELYVALRGSGLGVSHGTALAVFSPKGGVGKTTVSVNLAAALAASGARRVCLVDLDLAFGDVAITLQLFPSYTIEHAVGGEAHMEYEHLEPLLTRHESGLMVLAAPALPDARERVTPALVTQVLRRLREHFDYVVVDTAPSFDEQVLTALEEIDECVLVTTLDVPTLKNVKVALETLDVLGIADGKRHLLLNRADDTVGISTDNVESILQMPVAAQLTSNLEIAAATNNGRPIVLASPDSVPARQLRALADRLTHDPDHAAAPAGADRRDKDGGKSRRLRFRR